MFGGWLNYSPSKIVTWYQSSIRYFCNTQQIINNIETSIKFCCNCAKNMITFQEAACLFMQSSELINDTAVKGSKDSQVLNTILTLKIFFIKYSIVKISCTKKTNPAKDTQHIISPTHNSFMQSKQSRLY